MIRNHQSDSHSAQAPSSKSNITSWQEKPKSESIRLEQEDGTFHIFPYPYLMATQLRRSAEGHCLKLTFSTHEAEVEGRDLRELALAFEKQAVEWIKEIPSKYAALVPTGAPLVLSISVSDKSEQQEEKV